MTTKNIFKNLIFLDTETTGIKEEDRIFQIAYIYNNEKKESLFKPPLPISIEASEATHYTNEDVEDKEAVKNSDFQKELKKILNQEDTIFIAHNAKFDIQMLEKDNIKVNSFIDTYKVAQALDPEGKLGAYRLQYLRYALKLNTKGAQAHDAMGDVIVLKALFERLYNKMTNISPNKNREEVLEEMIKISQEPVLIKKFSFGKYIGKSIKEVYEQDPGYLSWLLKQKEQQASEGDVDEDWIFTLKFYLG